MKKVTLLQLYKDSESLFTKYGINVYTESKLGVYVSFEKDHGKSEIEQDYSVRFTQKKDDEEYLFAWGHTVTQVLDCLERKIKEKLNIIDELETIIIE